MANFSQMQLHTGLIKAQIQLLCVLCVHFVQSTQVIDKTTATKVLPQIKSREVESLLSVCW